jgi:hypothetical protein
MPSRRGTKRVRSVSRIADNNKAIENVNINLPKGEEWLGCCEMEARRISSGFTTLGAPPRLIH